MKEIDEGEPMSARFLVIMARKLGFLSGDGFANLRAGQSILQKYGCPSVNDIPDDENHNLLWDQFSDQSVITDELLQKAALHKSQSFWFISNHTQALRALDEGRPVEFGVSWKSSMNMNGGFTVPWVLNWLLGYVVGGHAFYAYDWDLNKRLFKCRNSFGEGYGENGDMYIRFEDFDVQVGTYGAIVNLDIPKDTGRWIKENIGKVFKEKGGSRCYFVGNGVKQLFPDELTLMAYGFTLAGVQEDSENILPSIPNGDNMSFWYAPRLQQFYELAKMVKDGNLKEKLKVYFSDLIV